MATMQHRPRPLTVDQFIERYEGLNGKYELIDGEVYSMAGGSTRHADVAGNILISLGVKLRGSGCRPRNSDAGLWIDDRTFVYPDVAVYCDPRDNDRDLLSDSKLFYPSLIFEVLSPTTASDDRGRKLMLYQSLESVQAVVLVDPATRSCETFTRVDVDTWTNTKHRPGATLTFTNPAVTLTADEIFADD